MSIDKDSLRKGYWHIYKNRFGLVEQLKSIHHLLPEYFARLGFISYGVNNVGKLRYHTTEYGAEKARLNYIAITAVLTSETIVK